mmetsp:Transcript_511/g.1195  ORF Transcript_511/g.1195 Transcript_511/m.1195 type:complete len:222 (-) Transcript_511:60-725(-)|eukprot:CAMPEP_0174244912 /NCGR_PEP_ID=MMETSP0417-20130205/36990_1 /TAXON_ID=242541 /ORGANISM="Mayorella sp, Strain BSH-02190019" /LENGTH=221 /DNA_ID=CAMNT_0015324649 /DNA_START=108 /DNA_END=773 /DNA_ORIENTATION=+
MTQTDNPVFNGYEREFTSKAKLIRRKISQLQGLQGERRREEIVDIERQFDEARRYLERMDEVARDSSSRGVMESVTIERQAELTALRRSFSNHKERSAFGGEFDDGDDDEDFQAAVLTQRARVLDNHQRLNQQTDLVQEAHAVILGTEQRGLGVVDEMAEQGESLLRSRDRVADINDDVDTSRTVLMKMAVQAFKNKILLCAVIVLLGGAIAAEVYFKFFH